MDKVQFGWTVVRCPDHDKNSKSPTISYFPKLGFAVYPRSTPADAKHFAADLAPFTHATKTLAIAAGKRGEYAYKRAP